MKPTYRYFRRSTGSLYKVRTGEPTCSAGNTYSNDGGATWSPTRFHLADMLSSEGFWGSEPLPVEVNAPDAEKPDAPTPKRE